MNFQKCTKYFGGALFFFFAVYAGYCVGARSWNGTVKITDGSLFDNSRIPAAIRKEIDFSKLDGAELINATQKRLVTAARVVASSEGGGQIGLELGHFVTRAQDGKKKLACDAFFNRVALRFEADGIAAAGDKTMMEVDSPCRINFDNINNIETIWIPVAKLMKERPTDMDLTYEDDVKFRFMNMPGGEWPGKWNLLSVRLYNSQDSAHEVKISQRELRELRPAPIVVKFDSDRAPAKAR